MLEKDPKAPRQHPYLTRHPPRLGTRLKARQVDQPATVIAIAWKAQQRLHHLWRRLDSQRHMRRTIVAVARELACWFWAAATAP